MALAERLMSGLSITLLGMSLVFLLLAVLWGLLVLMLRLDREPPATEVKTGGRAGRLGVVAPPGIAPDLLAAIGIAVLTHQAVLRKQAAPFMRSHWPGSILFASRWVSAGRHQQTQNWHPGKR